MQNAIAKLENEHIMCSICARGTGACRRKKLEDIIQNVFGSKARALLGRYLGKTSIELDWWIPPLLISSGALPNCKQFHQNISYLAVPVIAKQAQIYASNVPM